MNFTVKPPFKRDQDEPQRSSYEVETVILRWLKAEMNLDDAWSRGSQASKIFEKYLKPT